MIPANQTETAALLRALSGRDPIETPISTVFVGPDQVWKLRKAIRLDFVDFSTPSAREHASRREIALSAPHAPGLYRDVVPVLRSPDGTLGLGEPGQSENAIDWVVRMAPIPPADFLADIVARHGLSPQLADALGDAIAAYHAALPPATPLADLATVAAGNAASARHAGLPEAQIAAWEAAIQQRLSADAPWRAARAASGHVRRAHGDLHLGNLALWHGRPTPFDALEFNEALATIDLGYDLAFLLMDLDHRAGRAAANRVMNRCLARSGDTDMLRGLPTFLSLRAMVRAHVTANGGNDGTPYLAQALAALEPIPPKLIAPKLIAIGGLPGTGKSTLARALAPTLGIAPGALILRSDEIRKRQHGVSPETALPESAYSEAANRAVSQEILHAAAQALTAGHSVIADATFLDPTQRQAIAAAAGPAPFTGLWLQAPLPLLEARITARTNDASDADITLLHRMATTHPPAKSWHQLDAATDTEAQRAAVARWIGGGEEKA